MERRSVVAASPNPRRRSIAGPVQLPTLTNPGPQSFAVTEKYVKGSEANKFDNMLKDAQVAESVKISGPVSIINIIKTTTEVLCCQYTEDFEKLAVGFTDGMIRLFQTNTGELTETLCDAETEKNAAPVTGIKHRPVSKVYPITDCVTCTYTSGCVKCWNHSFSQCVYTIREKRQTYGLTYHPRLPKFVTFGDDSKIYLYDEETKTQERILSSSDAPGSIDGHTSRIFTCCFNPRSNHEFLSGGWDEVVYYWDLRQPHAIRHLSGVHICGEGIDINNKGSEILTCGYQKQNPLKIWEYGTGKMIAALEPDIYESMLYCGAYVNSDFIVCGGSDANMLRLINTRAYTTTASISDLPNAVISVDMGPHPKKKKETKTDPQIAQLPRIAFCCGNKIYQVEFS